MKKFQLVLISLFVLVACKKSVDSAPNNNSSTVITESSVPAAVMSSFNTSFSSATEREWHHGSDDSFTCQFNMDHQRHEAAFDDKGHESHHSVICMNTAVAQLILDAFTTNFPTDLVTEWTLTSDNTWKAHFMRNAVQWEVIFSNTGSIIKQEHD
jgi:hypothetical protein